MLAELRVKGNEKRLLAVVEKGEERGGIGGKERHEGGLVETCEGETHLRQRALEIEGQPV